MTPHKSDSIEDRRQRPWAMVENGLLRDPSITPQCKALYGLLITYGPDRIFPGHQTLADCLGVSRSSIIRWLGDMHTTGLIEWDRRIGTSNKYYILGYQNYLRNRDVALVTQGCSTGDTGGVALVTHDLEPLNQNQEQEKEPPAADSPADEPFYLEGETPTAPMQSHTKDEINTLTRQALQTYAQNGGNAGVADPTKEVDPWRDKPVRAWCAFIRLPYSEQSPGRIGMLAKDLRNIATLKDDDGQIDRIFTPDDVYQAIKTMAQSASCEWMRSAGRPTHKEFTNVLTNVLCGQTLPEGRKANGGSSGPRQEQPTTVSFEEPAWMVAA